MLWPCTALLSAFLWIACFSISVFPFSGLSVLCDTVSHIIPRNTFAKPCILCFLHYVRYCVSERSEFLRTMGKFAHTFAGCAFKKPTRIRGESTVHFQGISVCGRASIYHLILERVQNPRPESAR